jgi:serine/threonine protein kinase
LALRLVKRQQGRDWMIFRMSNLKVRQKVGKYRIERRLGAGGFANVYAAMDTIEGIRVALKVPHASVVDDSVLKDFRNEVRLAARLEHPNILPLRYAGFVDEKFVIVFQLGETTLSDRIARRLSLQSILDYGQQMLEATSSRRISFCLREIGSSWRTSASPRSRRKQSAGPAQAPLATWLQSRRWASRRFVPTSFRWA